MNVTVLSNSATPQTRLKAPEALLILKSAVTGPAGRDGTDGTDGVPAEIVSDPLAYYILAKS